MVRRALLPLFAVLIFSSSVSHAQWQLDGTILAAAPSDQLYPVVATDNAGGAIVVWQDFRSGASYDLYVQRVNSFGVAQWATNGVVICNLAGDQDQRVIVPDGTGGAIIAWRDFRGGNATDIYAQRVNAAGVVQWTANGAAICAAAGAQSIPAIVADGAGGAVIAWHDRRFGISYDIFAQRINSAGVVQWTPDGVLLCNAGGDQTNETIVSDGAGGAVVTWEDNRSGNADIYTQRINNAGAVQWAANGVAVCNATGNQSAPATTSDGAAGAIVTWFDLRTASYDVYVQHINSAGVAQWTANGIALSTATNNQIYPTIASDGSGGAIITWEDFRSTTNYDIYGQRIDAAGITRWTPDGIPLSTAANDQTFPLTVADGTGGAIVTWQDYRNGNYDVYAQRVDGTGALLWGNVEAAVCTASGEQSSPTITTDGSNGAIVAWHDFRSGAYHIYGQRIEGNYGYWGRPEPTLVSVRDVPKDEGGHVALNWTASQRDIPVPSAIDHYSIWRATDIGPSGYYWEKIGTQPATRFATYSFSAETRADSVAGHTSVTFFMVTAHAQADDQIAFVSNVLSGHSVDNLAPVPPLALTAERVGDDVRLTWHRVRAPDLRGYSVYRKTSAGVTPVPANLVANATDTVLVDADAPRGALHYIVTATDAHANSSAPSNEAALAPTSGAGTLPPITALMVLQNRPNPFAGTTELEIGLPSASNVEISVYDVAGRRVRAQALLRQPAGWQHITFDGRGDAGQLLPSGVYFCRVTTGAATFTRKMVIAR